MLPIMNTAFGEPSSANLPFDMRHLRHPLTYCLKEDATPDERKKVKEQLVKDLEGAIKLMLPSVVLEKTASEKIVCTGMPSTTDPSTFLQPGETFIASIPYNRGEQTSSLPEGQRLFLRLIPTTPLESSITNVALLDWVRSGRLSPMLHAGGSWLCERNKYGVYVYAEAYERILGVTQLFKTGELWGINTNCIEKDRLMAQAGVDFGLFPCAAFEKIFASTLADYLLFAQETLKLRLPLKIKAGATNVEGYRMICPIGHSSGFTNFDGRVVDQHITWEGTVEDYAMQPHQILRPFFNHVWDACGLERPDQEYLG
jgi:hypothetical protein